MSIITTNHALAGAACVALSLLLASATGPAQAGGRHGGHGPGYNDQHHAGHGSRGHPGHRHPGRSRGGVSIGIGVGSGGYGFGYGAPWTPWGYPGYGMVLPPPVVYRELPTERPPQPLAKGPPDPVFDPRRGQSAARTEADLHDCNRWALVQPGAIARADVFHRATLACMEERDYTVR
ncbi:MAG: hypothetical protein H0W48_04390 [Methylibium sp.]|nr:hypothetical protein [Methylibium sp.]